MKYELNKNNNSKKLVIGVSILFCTVILIIGVTTAYFTQSGVGDTGNIVTYNINGTIGFTNNNDYMRHNLIPVKEGDVSLFATKNSVNTTGEYTNEDICHYQDDMYACSLYEFTITNNADVTQDMKVTLNPDPNEFTNLHYLIYESKQLELNADSKVAKEATPIDKENASTMIESVTLTPKESKTYTVVFYIKAMGYDQTGEDADKNFGAIIRVDSITTGEFEIETAGTTCYDEPELITEGDYAGGYRLTKFNGIDENGNANSSCGVTESNGFYSVTIPSSVGGVPITALGNNLFSAMEMKFIEGQDMPEFIFNNYSKINNIVISEGIKVIENGDMDSFVGTFFGIGIKVFDDENGSSYYENGFSLSIPRSLEVIGDLSFSMSHIASLKLPANIKKYGNGVFGGTTIDHLILDDGIITIPDNLFDSSNIISDKDNPLIIPKTVTYIGNNAFGYNPNLTAVTFEGALDGTSQLETVGIEAFNGCDLNYQTKSEPLIIPTNIKKIGSYAFDTYFNFGYENLKYILYLGADEDILNNRGFTETEGWYIGWYADYDDQGELQATLLTSLDQMTE